MIYEFYLPFPPTVNNYYVKTQRGVFISQKGRKFRDQTAESIHMQLGAAELPANTKLLVEVILYPPDKRKRDLDNYMKPLLDAITQTGLWEDDSLVDQLFIYRGEPLTSGRVFVRISEAAPILPQNYELPLV